MIQLKYLIRKMTGVRVSHVNLLSIKIILGIGWRLRGEKRLEGNLIGEEGLNFTHFTLYFNIIY